MKVIKNILVILLALAVFGSGLLVEGVLSVKTVESSVRRIMVVPYQGGVSLLSGSVSVDLKKSVEMKENDVIETGSQQSADIKLLDNGILRIGPSSRILFKKQVSGKNDYLFVLEKGRVWVNNEFSSDQINLMAGGALLIPFYSRFDLDFDNEKTDVRVFANQVGIGLLDKMKMSDKFYSPHDSSFINYYLLAQGSQTTIYKNKVDTESLILAKLYYSKLVKEFQVGLIDKTALENNQWYKKNNQSDADMLISITRYGKEKINLHGLKVASLNSLGFQLQKSIDDLGDLFVLSKDKSRKKKISDMFDNLIDAEYLVLFGRSSEAKDRLNLFDQMFSGMTIDNDSYLISMLYSRLDEEYVSLAFVPPDDPLFEIKSHIKSLIMKHLSDDDMMRKFYLVREDINYAFMLADKGQLSDAKVSLEKYFMNVTELIKNQRAQIRASSYLMSEENEILNNLLKQYPVFYIDSFFAMKRTLEKEWLALIPDGAEKDEESQFIISNKIDFLKQLQNFFLNNQVSIKEARAIALRLINEIKDIQPNKELGINQLFAARLKDYGTFLRFLNSTDVSGLRGSAVRTSYDDFLAEQKELVSVEEVMNEFLQQGSVKPVITKEQIVDQILKDLVNAGIMNVVLGNLDTVQQKIVNIEGASFKNISFEASYDWSLKILYSIKVQGNIVAEEGVKLSNLEQILMPKLPAIETQQYDQVETQPTQEEVKKIPVSRTDIVIKALLLKKIRNYGITSLESSINIVDKDLGIFSFSEAFLVLDEQISFSFDFDNKQNLVSKLIVTTSSGDRPYDNVLDISDLAEKVKTIVSGG